MITCAASVAPQTRKARHGAVCHRPGTFTLTTGNIPLGPYCYQHGRKAEDRATAAAIDSGARVRLEATKETRS